MMVKSLIMECDEDDDLSKERENSEIVAKDGVDKSQVGSLLEGSDDNVIEIDLTRFLKP